MSSLEHTLGQTSALSAEVHADNVKVGWWSDKDTGDSILATRNRGEILMLVVSELSEASEGNAGCLLDDKITTRLMFEVELADTDIRLLDLLGADGGDTQPDLARCSQARDTLSFRSAVDAQLMYIVNAVANAMEGNRKGNHDYYTEQLWIAHERVVALADLHGLDLAGAIADKRAYNATRADHKLKNRRKPGGKAY